MSDEESGRIHYDQDRQKYIIEVNVFHHVNRQRFTIAHELGHILHGHLKGDSPITDNYLWRSHLSNPQEIEANRFAAKLLMPAEKLNQSIKSNKDLDIDKLSKKFKVSKQAIKIRLGIPI